MRWNLSVARRSHWTGLAVGFALLLSGVVSPALAQENVIVYNFGRIGLSQFSTMCPSMIYRPIDGLSGRPGGDALGMGGACLATTSGAMALGWNPAGMAGLERTSFAFDGYSRSTSGEVPDHPDSLLIPQTPTLRITQYDMNMKGGFIPTFLTVATPLWNSGERRLVAGFAWRRYAEVGMPEETVSELHQTGLGQSFPLVLSFDRTERGSVEAFTPGLAFRISPSISVGASLNVLDGGLRANTDERLTIVGMPLRGSIQTNFRYSGVSPEFGGQLRLGSRLSFGLRATPGYALKVRDGTLLSRSFEVPPSPATVVTAELADYDLKVPASFGAGVALQVSPRLLLAADMNAQSWSESKVEYTDNPPDSVGLPLEDVTTLHVGGEYKLIRARWGDVPVRLGFHTAPLGFLDVSPADVIADSVATDLGTVIDARYSGRYHGKQPKANAYTFGLSLDTPGIRYDLGYERVSYEFHKWFFDVPWDPIANPHMDVVNVKRTVNRLRVSATYTF